MNSSLHATSERLIDLPSLDLQRDPKVRVAKEAKQLLEQRICKWKIDNSMCCSNRFQGVARVCLRSIHKRIKLTEKEGSQNWFKMEVLELL